LPRPLHELTNVGEPAWPELEGHLRTSGVPVEILPIEPEHAARELHRIQVTVRSYLGALAFHTGGLLIDHGWVRVLGGGHTGLPSLADANQLPADPVDGVLADLLVGHDVLGGQFAVNGPDPAAIGRPGGPGQVCYHAPDSMEWESLEMGHGEWLLWLSSPGRLAKFYQSLRWTDWQDDATDLPLDKGISIFPPLWSKEAHDDLDATNRRPASIYELF
jgi:Protein of unknown function DUF2625